MLFEQPFNTSQTRSGPHLGLIHELVHVPWAMASSDLTLGVSTRCRAMQHVPPRSPVLTQVLTVRTQRVGAALKSKLRVVNVLRRESRDRPPAPRLFAVGGSRLPGARSRTIDVDLGF